MAYRYGGPRDCLDLDYHELKFWYGGHKELLDFELSEAAKMQARFSGMTKVTGR